ncbi:hypothetical protein PI125_g5103 [Phytophthora idaei]|nr:hypothetical protein PI125_g5103 [Phytophthora idaei]
MPLRPWLWTLLLSILVYTATRPLDHIPGGDSGELLAEACVGGVAHPPGYPLLLSLLRVVRWASQMCSSDGDNSIHFALLANAINAFIAAGAAACVTHSVYLMTRKKASVAVAAGLCFALSKLTWEYARGVEVFALNNLLVGTLHILIVRHFVQPTTKNAWLGAFVCGLGLANQHTIVLFEAPFILWVLLTYRFRVVELLAVAFGFISGLSLYLQTFLSAQEPTPGSWGDTSTLAGLFAHIRRKEYGTFRLSPLQGDSEGLLTHLKIYTMDCAADFHWIGLILICLGAKTLMVSGTSQSKLAQRKSFPSWYHRVGYAQMSALACYLLVFHSLANLPLDSPMPRAVSSRFNMQPNTILAIWLGLGLSVATRGVASVVVADGNWTRAIRCSICLVLVAAQYQRNRLAGDDLPGDLIRRHGETIFDVIPRNGVLLSYTDINWNSLRYLQACEGIRPDVTLLSLQLLPFPWFPRQHELYPSITFPPMQRGVSTVKNSPGYARLLHEFLAANIGKHGDHLFLDLHAVNDEDIAPNGQYLGFTLTPHGLVWKVSVPPLTTAESDALYTQWETIPPPSVYFAPSLYPAGSWEFASATIANDACYQGALFALSYWLERGKTIQHASEAAKYVLGMRHTFQLLTQVEADAAVTDRSWGLTYDKYDLTKNTALAAMRYSSGLELMQPLIAPLKDHQRLSGASRQDHFELQELDKLVQHLHETRQVAVARVKSLLKEMKLRQDPDINAFNNFVESQHAPKKKKGKKRKSKKHKLHL